MRVRVVTPLKPSEDRKKVEAAILNVFPDATLQREDAQLVGTTESLKGFRDLVWKQRILDAARRILLAGLGEDDRSATFTLSKQAAFGGRVSFAIAAAPLGDLRVHVEGEHLEARFKEIAPPTLRGHPVSEETFEKHLEKSRKAAAAKPVVAEGGLG